MTTNVGFQDRFIRLSIAGAILSSYFYLPGPSRYIAILGIVPFFTGLVGWCPLYSLFGIDTCSTR